MNQHLTRKNIAIAVLSFLLVITLFQLVIVRYIGNTKSKTDLINIAKTNVIPDNNIMNEIQGTSTPNNNLQITKTEKPSSQILRVKPQNKIVSSRKQIVAKRKKPQNKKNKKHIVSKES